MAGGRRWMRSCCNMWPWLYHHTGGRAKGLKADHLAPSPDLVMPLSSAFVLALACWLASLFLACSASSIISLKASGNHNISSVPCYNTALFSHHYWSRFSPELQNCIILFHKHSPFTGAPNLPVITSKKFPTLVSTLLKMIPLFWLLKWVAMEAMKATWKNAVLSQLSITCTCIEESATILFLYLQSVYFPDRDVLLGPDPRPLNTSNNTPIEGNWKSASFLTFNCPIHDCKGKCMGKNLQSRTLVWDFIYLWLSLEWCNRQLLWKCMVFLIHVM